MPRATSITLALGAAIVGIVAGHPAGADEATLDLMPPIDGPIVAHFVPPPTPFEAGHRGIDFQAPEGSQVVASAAGIVAFAGQVGGRLFVSIDHPVGLRTTYSFLDLVLVEAGQPVEQGDLIAQSGLGHDGDEPPHLHFGLRRGDEYLDPEVVLLRSMRRNLWRVLSLVPAA
jgi:murein DD-endopeptidase MepM/ murein hydrolase activator NlpD